MKRLLFLCWIGLSMVSRGADYRGVFFVGFSDFSKFDENGVVLTSPIVSSEVNWDELIVSWNLIGKGEIAIDVRVTFDDATTPYYPLAVWSERERHSVTNQADEFATVALDTLMMKRAGGKAQARVTLKGAEANELTFLGFCFVDTKAKPSALPPNRQAWRKTIDVPVRSQMDFAEGLKWCSPAGSSMVLEFWARESKRPELNLSVPEMASRVFDPSWRSAGHWTFNTAMSGHFPGMRSYVARLSDVSELEEWICAGIPVAASVSRNRLRGENRGGDGHLVVCVGFNRWGDVIVNDPGAQRDQVRRTFSRERFRAAWAESHNTVYLTYPQAAKIPDAKLGHWERK